jgi:flavin reductase (DIM6/NTAB) family NADH-FMN oxidoreductase RutF
MPSAFDPLVASLDYPMTIVTAGSADGARSGCLVGFTTQCSIHPPRWWVCLSKLNHTYGVALRAPSLAVHFPSAADRALAELFGEETGDEVDKFARCSWRPWPGDGVTPLLTDVGRWLVGPVLERSDGGDHVGFLVDVAESAYADGAPLTFQSVREMDPGHPVP